MKLLNVNKLLFQNHLIISIIFFLTTSQNFSQWESIAIQIQSNLNEIFFADSLNGWIVGEDSTIFHTSDGGLNWTKQKSGFSGYVHNYKDVFFANDTLGWIVGGSGYGGIILHSSNGGSSWVKQIEEITRPLNTIYFINDSVGWIGGGFEYPGGKIILKTYNRGLVWDTLLIEISHPYNSIFNIKFLNENTGWAVGGVYPGWGNIIMKTTDGGNNWITQLENYSYAPTTSCEFISEQVGWVTFAGSISSSVGIMKTTDGGTNWNIQYVSDSLAYEIVNSIIFVNNTLGWAAGAQFESQTKSRILHTYNGGLIWEPQFVPTNVTLNSIFFINKYKGWAVGDLGTILLTTNGGVTFGESEIINPSEYSLSQNYPNPFNPTTIIKYQIPELSFVTIKVYDVLGNEMATLVNEEKPVGTYEIEFYASNLTSGVYFYQLKAGSYSETRKMVLLR